MSSTWRCSARPTVEQPRLGLEVNVVGTFNVVEAAQRAGVNKVVFSSASSVYGDTDETMDEAHPLGGTDDVRRHEDRR